MLMKASRAVALIATIILLFVSTLSQGQGTIPSLRVSQLINFPSLPNDTIYQGASYDSILAVVVNDGNIPFQGYISIGMLADSSIFPVYLYYGNSAYFLLPGDSIVFNINNYTFPPGSFREGDNIVVVWPIGNTNVSDTLATDVYYVHTTGISDIYSEAQLHISPNPASDNIRVFKASDIFLEQVRIYSTDGRLLIRSLRSDEIDISGLEAGIYYIYFYHRKGISIRKLIKI